MSDSENGSGKPPEEPPKAAPDSEGNADSGQEEAKSEESTPSEAATDEAAKEEAAPDAAAPDAEAEAKAKAEAEAKAKAAAEAKAKAAAAAKAKAEAEAAKDPWERDPTSPEWEEADADSLVESLRAAHGEAIETARTFAGDLVIEVAAASIREVCASLKEEHGYKLLVDMCGAHYDKREERPLEMVYIFHNLEANQQVRLKVRADLGAEVPSVVPIYAGANWTEREAYDMFGIRFAGHPDMTRILTWEGFNGHPLLKDFPVEGIDTGAAIYPETYGEEAGPIAGTGTGWKPPQPPAEESASEGEEAGKDE